jgi:excisionase family DNA binding protein
MEPVAVTVTDACAAIGVGRTMLYQLLSERKLDSVTIGRRRLITTESIRRLVADAAQREPVAA